MCAVKRGARRRVSNNYLPAYTCPTPHTRPFYLPSPLSFPFPACLPSPAFLPFSFSFLHSLRSFSLIIPSFHAFYTSSPRLHINIVFLLQLPSLSKLSFPIFYFPFHRFHNFLSFHAFNTLCPHPSCTFLFLSIYSRLMLPSFPFLSFPFTYSPHLIVPFPQCFSPFSIHSVFLHFLPISTAFFSRFYATFFPFSCYFGT